MTVDPQQLARTIREAIDHLHREAVLYWISDGCDDAPIETHGQKDDALDALDALVGCLPPDEKFGTSAHEKSDRTEQMGADRSAFGEQAESGLQEAALSEPDDRQNAARIQVAGAEAESSEGNHLGSTDDGASSGSLSAVRVESGEASRPDEPDPGGGRAAESREPEVKNG